ncbi:hypothetical protein [Pseudomonas sp. NPDC090201]|uniref:hypothetical protein n=1 Tax=Pseudomonas sp. NPDC090201 TaxID=3364475 RepID=UPI0037F20CFE
MDNAPLPLKTRLKYGDKLSVAVARPQPVTPAGAPAPKAVDPALSAPTVAGQFASKKIPVAEADAGITVEVPRWPTMLATYRIRITWDGNDASSVVPTVPPFYEITAADVVDPNFKWTVQLPASLTAQEGTHVVSYRVTTRLGGNATWPTAGTTIIVDRTAPGGELLPILLGDDEQQLPPLITAANFINDEFITTVSDYDGIELNDVLVPWIQRGTDPIVRLPGSAEVVDADEVHTRKVKLRFKRSDVETLADGVINFGYNITDEPGNVSFDSPAARIRVILLDVPSQLEAPIVPAFLNDGVVSYSDAVAGVDVQIPIYRDPHLADVIVVDWGGQKSAPYSLTTADLTQDPVTTIKLLFPVVATAGSNPRLPVSYTVSREGLPYPSPVLEVNVDLRVPGGPDPETNLKQIVIESGTGDIDRISEAAFSLTAFAIVSNRTNDTPPQPSFVAGDIITVTWGGTDVAPPYTVATGDNAQPLRLAVAPGYFQATGNIPVNYRISRELQPPYTPPVREEGAPLPKLIPVESSQGKPNDGQPFSGPTYPDKNADDIIDRETAQRPVRVRTQVALTNMAEGDDVELTLKGVDFDSGADLPVPPLVQDHRISPEEFARGYYDFTVDRDFLRSICQGYMVGTYKLTNSRGSGISDASSVIVDLANTEFPFCEA